MCLEQGVGAAEAESPFSTGVSMTAVSSPPAAQTRIHRPLARQVSEVQATPGTTGLSGLADPGAGSRKQVPLCNLPRCLSCTFCTRPSAQLHGHGSLVLFALLPDFD